MKYDFNTQKMKNKVQINVNEWVQPSSHLEICQISGKATPTCFTKATFIGEGVKDIKKDDLIFISRVARDVATTPFASYDVEGTKYFDLPEEQVIGIFKETITLDTLTLRNRNVIFEKIEKRQDSTLFIEEKDTMLGKVIKTSKDTTLKEGDVIAIRDNVSTPFLDNYYAVEEKFVVGVLHDNLSIENMEVKNEYILMEPYIPSKVLNSTILDIADIDYNSLDYSDINNRNLFKVLYADSSLRDIQSNDIIIADRNYTNYMYYNNKRYIVINERKWISGKIVERDKQCK